MSVTVDHQAETNRREQVAAAARITDRVMRWLSPLLVFLTAAILWRATAHDGWGVAAVQLTILGLIAVVAFAGGSVLAPEIRMLLYCGGLVLAGLAGMCRWGLYASGQVGVILALSLASMLGLRRWLILLAVAGAGVALIAGGWVSGRLPLSFDPPLLLRSAPAWAVVMVAMLAASLTPLTWEQLYRGLRESETRYRMVFNAGGDALFIHDEDGRVLEANARACELLGMAPDQAGRITLAHLGGDTSPFSAEEAKRRIRLACAEGPQTFEWWFRRPDGAALWVEVDLRPCMIGGKRRVLAAARDITDRKATEQVLRDSSRQFQDIIDFLPDATFAIDHQGRVIAWNRAMEEMTGTLAGDVLGRGDSAHAVAFYGFRRPMLIDLVLRPDLESQADYRFVERSGETFFAESREVKVGGRLRHLSGKASPIRDARGEIIGAIESIRDITAAKQTEQALRDSEQRFRSVLEGLENVAIQAYEPDGTITFWNRGSELIYGFTADEVLGRDMVELLLDEPDRPQERRIMEEAVRTGRLPVTGEVEVVRKDGTRRHVLASRVLHPRPAQDPEFFCFDVDITDIRKVREALRESELFLKETQRIARLGGWKANPRTDYLEWTEGVFDLIEAPKDRQPGLAEGLRYYPPEHAPVIAERLTRCLETGEPFAIETEVVAAGGRRFWAEVRGLAPVVAGSRSYVIGTFQDITERKIAEQALRRHNRRLQVIAETSGFVLGGTPRMEAFAEQARRIREAFDVDLCVIRELQGDDLVLLASDGPTPGPLAERMSRHQGLAPHILATRRGLAVPDVRQDPRTAALASATDPLKYEFTSYAGVPLMYEGQPFGILGIFTRTRRMDFDESDLEHLQIVANNIAAAILSRRLYDQVSLQKEQLEQDIAERKRAEEKLAETQALLAAAVEQTPAGILIAEAPDVRIRLANPAALGIRGEPAESLTDIPVDLHPRRWQTFYPDGRPVPPEELPLSRAVLRGETCRNVEVIIRRSDGQDRCVLANAAPVRNPRGQIVAGVVVFPDITERKQAEQELQRKNEEIERFAYTASHDLRSPLVTIRAFLGHIRQDIEAGNLDQVRQDLGYMDKAAERMAGLLDEILELSRIGRKVNPPEDATLQDLAREAVEMVAGRLSQRKVRVEINPRPLVLRGDRPRLREVFQNLIDNAAKFMGDQPEPRIEIGVEDRGGRPVVFVRDNGMGIDPRHMHRLFGLFEQLHPGIEGTGMGLAIVKRIVEFHGGRIWAESEGPGRGSTFCFTLPTIRSATLSPEPDCDQEQPQ